MPVEYRSRHTRQRLASCLCEPAHSSPSRLGPEEMLLNQGELQTSVHSRGVREDRGGRGGRTSGSGPGFPAGCQVLGGPTSPPGLWTMSTLLAVHVRIKYRCETLAHVRMITNVYLAFRARIYIPSCDPHNIIVI